jgi:hypothetical protein
MQSPNSNQNDFIMTTDFSEKNHRIRNAYKNVKQMTDADEQIYQAIVAISFPSVRPFLLYGRMSLLMFQQRFIGFTSKGIVIIRIDSMGKPADLSRMDYTDIKSMQYKRRMLMDRVRVYETEKSGMTWWVSALFRDQIFHMLKRYAPKPEESEKA